MRHLAQSLVIAIIYFLLDLGLERGLLTQTTVQNVAVLLFRVLTIVTRVCSPLVIPTSHIDHNLLERESKQQRLYSIAAYYTSKCLTDSPMFIIMVFFFTTIGAVLPNLRQLKFVFFCICRENCKKGFWVKLNRINGIRKTLFSQAMNKCKSSANSKDLISYTDLLFFIFLNNLL
jgi:hypothetical protein